MYFLTLMNSFTNETFCLYLCFFLIFGTVCIFFIVNFCSVPRTVMQVLNSWGHFLCICVFHYLRSQFTEKNSGGSSKVVTHAACCTFPTHGPTDAPGEPVSAGRSILITEVQKETKKQKKHDMKETGSSSGSSFARPALHPPPVF